MTGGSSGGPWVFGFEGQNPVLGSLNSYGRSGDPNMYGPKFNSTTTAVYNAANGATETTSSATSRRYLASARSVRSLNGSALRSASG